MVHDKIYHDLISWWCCAESNGCETGCPSYNHKACVAVAKREVPVLKWAGLRNGLVHMYNINSLFFLFTCIWFIWSSVSRWKIHVFLVAIKLLPVGNKTIIFLHMSQENVQSGVTRMARSTTGKRHSIFFGLMSTTMTIVLGKLFTYFAIFLHFGTMCTSYNDLFITKRSWY